MEHPFYYHSKPRSRNRDLWLPTTNSEDDQGRELKNHHSSIIPTSTKHDQQFKRTECDWNLLFKGKQCTYSLVIVPTSSLSGAYKRSCFKWDSLNFFSSIARSACLISSNGIFKWPSKIAVRENENKRVSEDNYRTKTAATGYVKYASQQAIGVRNS